MPIERAYLLTHATSEAWRFEAQCLLAPIVRSTGSAVLRLFQDRLFQLDIPAVVFNANFDHILNIGTSQLS